MKALFYSHHHFHKVQAGSVEVGHERRVRLDLVRRYSEHVGNDHSQHLIIGYLQLIVHDTLQRLTILESLFGYASDLRLRWPYLWAICLSVLARKKDRRADPFGERVRNWLRHRREEADPRGEIRPSAVSAFGMSCHPAQPAVALEPER